MTPPVAEQDVALRDGRTVHVWDSHPGEDDRLAVVWHHGAPNIGAPPGPLLATADELGLRWVSHTRPGYPGSTRHDGRRVADVAPDVVDVLDHLGIDACVTMGHSAGGAHALATAALLAGRVRAVCSIAGLAPFDAPGLDWFAGFAAGGAAELRAASAGRAALEAHLDVGEEADLGFTPGDEAALDPDVDGRWAWFLDVVRPAVAQGPAGFVDDDLAAVAPPGFGAGDVDVPALVVHGDADTMVPTAHGRWWAAAIPGAELWERPGDGHITVMDAGADALAWLARA